MRLCRADVVLSEDPGAVLDVALSRTMSGMPRPRDVGVVRLSPGAAAYNKPTPSFRAEFPGYWCNRDAGCTTPAPLYVSVIPSFPCYPSWVNPKAVQVLARCIYHHTWPSFAFLGMTPLWFQLLTHLHHPPASASRIAGLHSCVPP